jgi:hypothetical protein
VNLPINTSAHAKRTFSWVSLEAGSYEWFTFAGSVGALDHGPDDPRRGDGDPIVISADGDGAAQAGGASS